MNKQSKHADAQSNETFYNEVPYQGSSLPQVRMVRASKSHASAVFLIRTRGEFDNNGVSEEGEGQERGGGGVRGQDIRQHSWSCARARYRSTHLRTVHRKGP